MKKILPFAILITAILISSCKSQKEQVHERPSEAGFVVIGYVPGSINLAVMQVWQKEKGKWLLIGRQATKI